jgi:hypothetical protein
VHQKDNPQKPPAKVKRTKEEMEIPLNNRKKTTTDSPRSAFKKKNRIEEGGALSLGVKKEEESTNLRAQKMMRGIVEPFVIPIVVRAVPPMVQVVR